MKWIFFLLISIGLFCCSDSKQINVSINADAACFLEGNDSILKYQITEKSLNGKYKRANYIHPIYSLNSEVLTEDFPEDHPHHRGIFWAWHQLYIGDKRIGDGWEINHFSWDVVSVKELPQSSSTKAIQAEVLWKSDLWLDFEGNEKPFVKEVTILKVYPKTENYRPIDIEITLLALESNMRMGGSEDAKGYGGFSPRIKLPNDVAFTSSTGHVTPENLPIKAGPWMDISGSFTEIEEPSGITILCHPNNPKPINQWILRKQRSMQNAVYPFPGAEPVILSQTHPTILKYRLIIHSGDAKSLDINSIYSDYKIQ
ncbi:DUF6807 family protein [Flavobacteriaceae bacterium SZ-1-7]|uniref:DUF6807 family protein n=1 Tax=Tamlana sedimenti TaxID=3134126 RepID=UPI00312685E4